MISEQEYVITSFRKHFQRFQDKGIVVYGLGKNTEVLLDALRDEYHFIGLMDGVRTGETVYGLPVLTVDEAQERGVGVILILARAANLSIIYPRIAADCERYGIPFDRAHIVGHGELMATDCPGDNLQALLDDGTIVGKAIFYYNQSHGIEDMSEAPQEQDGSKQAGRGAERFNTVNAVPDWAKPTVEKMIGKGLLQGNGESLDLSLDMLRAFVINDRAGLYS